MELAVVTMDKARENAEKRQRTSSTERWTINFFPLKIQYFSIIHFSSIFVELNCENKKKESRENTKK